MIKNKLFEMLLKKPAILLVNLRDEDYGLKLARKSNVSYAHSYHIFKLFKERGLINSKGLDGLKRERFKVLSLTDKGKQIAECLKKIFALIEQNVVGGNKNG